VRCTNPEAGYSIGHPGAWNRDAACRFFDPEPVEFVPNSDGFFFALMVVAGEDTFTVDRHREDTRFSRTLLHEVTTLGGRRAVRFETEVVGRDAPVAPARMRFYGYSIERDGKPFDVLTFWWPPDFPESEYEARKAAVDSAVRTVRFA
jgi:hypothetical protein